MKKIILGSVALMTFLACSHKVTNSGSNSSAGSDKPKADANAMYTTDIKPIIEAKCTPCHFPDKGGNKAALDNFATVSNNITEVLERVQKKPDERGFMPFRSKKDPLTPAEIASLKAFQATVGK